MSTTRQQLNPENFQQQQQSSSTSKNPKKNTAQYFRHIESCVRSDGSAAAFFAMSFLQTVLAQPPRRPDVVRRRKYDASLSLMDVIRGHADSAMRLDAQWPLEYPLATIDAIRRTVIPASTSNSASDQQYSSSSSTKVTSATSHPAIDKRLMFSMRTLTTLRIPLLRIGVSPTLLHFWGLLDPADPLKDGWQYMPQADTTGSDGDIYRYGQDHAALNLFVDWPASTFLISQEDDDDEDEDEDEDEEDFGNNSAAAASSSSIGRRRKGGGRKSNSSSNTFSNSRDEGPAWLTGITITVPNQQCLLDCKDEIYPSSTRPGEGRATPKRSAFVASHVLSQCDSKNATTSASSSDSKSDNKSDNTISLDIPMSIEYVIKSAFSEWAVSWRAKRAVDRTSMLEPDLAAAAALEERQNIHSTTTMVNPLLELEAYAAQAKQKQDKLRSSSSGGGIFSNDNKNKNKRSSSASGGWSSSSSQNRTSSSSQRNKKSSSSLGERNLPSPYVATDVPTAIMNSNENTPTASSSSNRKNNHHNNNRNNEEENDENNNNHSIVSPSSLVTADVESNPFISLGSFICARLRGLTNCCMSCGAELSCSVVRPSTCGLELCNYSAAKYGRDFLCRFRRGNGAVAEFLIICAINAVALSNREVMLPMCNCVVADDGSISEVNNTHHLFSMNMLGGKVTVSPSLLPSSPSPSSPSLLQQQNPASPTSMISSTAAAAAAAAASASPSSSPLLNQSSSSSAMSPLAQTFSQQSPQHQSLSPPQTSSSSSSPTSQQLQISAFASSPTTTTTTGKSNQNKVFSKPASKHFYKKEDDIGTGVNKNIPLLLNTLNGLPPVPKMMYFLRELSAKNPPLIVEQKFFEWLQNECSEEEGRLLAGPLVRWLFTSLGGDLVLLPKTHLIPRVKTEIQFLVVGTDPEREARFQALKQRELERRRLEAENRKHNRKHFNSQSAAASFFDLDGSNSHEIPDDKNDPFITGTKSRASFFAWHGSGPSNWHSIIRNGLRNMSHTHMMSTGALHGGGIYLARTLHISLAYSLQPVAGWKRASVIPHTNGISVVGLCEVVDWNAISSKAPDPRFQRRYPERNKNPASPTDPVQVHADGQIVTVLQSDYVMLRALMVYTDRTPRNMDGFELQIPDALMSFMESQYN